MNDVPLSPTSSDLACAVTNLNHMSQDLLSGSLGADKLTARFQETLSPKALIDLRTQKPAAALNPDLITAIEHELREAVVIFEKEKQRLTGEIQRLNAVVKTQETQYAELLSRCTNEKRQSDRKIEELLHRVRELEAEKSHQTEDPPEDVKVSKQLAQVQTRAKYLETNNAELVAANTALVEQNRNLTSQLAKLQSKAAVADEEQFLLLSNYKKMQQNLHEKVQVEADLKLQVSSLTNEVEKLNRSLANEKNKYAQKTGQLESELKAKAEQTFTSTAVSAPTLDLSGAFNLTNFEVQMKDNSRRIQRLEQQLHETSHQYQTLKHSFCVEEKPAARLKSSTSSRSLTPVRSHSRSQDQRSTHKQKAVSPKPVKTARPSRHSQKLSWRQPH